MLLILIFSPIPFKLLQVYPEGKMSQHFATLKSGDVVEVKGLVIHNHKLKDIYCTLSLSQMPFSCCRPIEKLRYSPNMKKHIGMVRAHVDLKRDEGH